MGFSLLNKLKFVIGSPSSDNFVFQLCYRWTVLLLVVFSFVVTCRSMLGDSFTCIAESDDLPKDYVNAKCYADATYTFPSKLTIRKDAPPLVDPFIEESRRYQSYYSWVNLLFLVHAFNLYLPHLLWKTYEGGYMYKLTAGIQKFFDKEEKRGLELCYLAKYVLTTQGKHRLYTSMYIFFEACNYAICLAQTVWLVHFFEVTGVPDFLPFQLGTWAEFRNFYFPPSAVCDLVLSTSGKVTKINAMCELPLNRLFMQMFLFLHAWYIFIALLCGAVLLYRILLLIPALRLFAARSSAYLAEQSVLKSLCYRMKYCDWFFLTRLQKTMTDVDFAQLLDKIAIVSKDDHKGYDRRSSLFEDAIKDFEISGGTSPVQDML